MLLNEKAKRPLFQNPNNTSVLVSLFYTLKKNLLRVT